MPLDSASAPSCVTSAKIAGRSPSVSELVFCLDEIQCLGSVDDSQTTMHGSEFDAVVLASLALEHAKRVDWNNNVRVHVLQKGAAASEHGP